MRYKIKSYINKGKTYQTEKRKRNNKKWKKEFLKIKQNKIEE